MQLITEYPIWYTGFCLLLGGGYAAFLYLKNNRLNELNPILIKILFILRLVTVALLSFFLLSPLLKTVIKQVEKPIIIFAQDNSSSLLAGNDSSFYQNGYATNIQNLTSELEKDFQVKKYAFGEKIEEIDKYSYSDRETNISNLFDEIEIRYANRNVGALILASDGIYNKGANPLYQSTVVDFPVYTIALGDTVIKKDAIIAKIRHNKLAYLGNKFPVEISIEARQLKDQKLKIELKEYKKLLFDTTIIVSENIFSTKIPVLIEAKKIGLRKYTAIIQPFEGEVSWENNTKDIYVDVLDARQKILLLATAPHPDIAAITAAIKTNDNYEVDVAILKDWEGNIEQYNLVVLHQLTNDNELIKIVNRMEEKQIPTFVIAGGGSDVNILNRLNFGIKISNNRNNSNNSQAALNNEFNLFSISDELKSLFKDFPPLVAPFGNYTANSSTVSLLTQKIGVVDSKQPLLSFSKFNDRKIGVLTGEGLWRWKYQNYVKNKNHKGFNQLILKVVQYLSLKAKKNQFRVNSNNSFWENEKVIFEAELYNDSYELITDAEIKMLITDDEGNEFSFLFSALSQSYKLDAGILPVGEYRYTATAVNNGKQLVEKGVFTIKQIQLELIETIANHQLLYQLAGKSGGELIAKEKIQEIASKIKARNDVTSIVYTQDKLFDLINLKWIFFCLVTLLSAEWFIRKRQGVY